MHTIKINTKRGNKRSTKKAAVLELVITRHIMPYGKDIVFYKYQRGHGWTWIKGLSNPLWRRTEEATEQRILNTLWRTGEYNGSF